MAVADPSAKVTVRCPAVGFWKFWNLGDRGSWVCTRTSSDTSVATDRVSVNVASFPSATLSWSATMTTSDGSSSVTVTVAVELPSTWNDSSAAMVAVTKPLFSSAESSTSGTWIFFPKSPLSRTTSTEVMSPSIKLPVWATDTLTSTLTPV